MRVGRLLWVGLFLLGIALYFFVAEDASSPGPGASSSFDREAAKGEHGVAVPAASAPAEFACPEGATRVDQGSIRFCTFAVADGLAIQEGPYLRFHDSNRESRAEQGEYLAGRKQGAWTEWYVSGERRSKLEFRDGRADGRWLEWYEDGTPKSEGYYADGEEHGLWTLWGPGGEISERGKMRVGERDGDWAGWHVNGAERYRRHYRNGVATSWEEWDPRGEPASASDRGPID